MQNPGWQPRREPAGGRLPRPALMLVTEPMDRDRLTDVVRRAVAGGVNVVQLRDRSATPRELLTTAAVLKLYFKDTVVIVNGCPSVAHGAHASGVHLPERSFPLAYARDRAGPGSLVGRSVHSVSAAIRAEADGADYLVAGTIFASGSHPGTEPAGLEFLRNVCASVRIPVLAIGGITPERVLDCMTAGAAGVAVLSAIMRAIDPYAAGQDYWSALTRVGGSNEAAGE